MAQDEEEMGNGLGMQIPTVFRLQGRSANLGVTGTWILPNKPLVKKAGLEQGSRLLGAHPEGGVEVDVICAAHILVLFFCTVQSSDTDGSSPVYKAKMGP